MASLILALCVISICFTFFFFIIPGIDKHFVSAYSYIIASLNVYILLIFARKGWHKIVLLCAMLAVA